MSRRDPYHTFLCVICESVEVDATSQEDAVCDGCESAFLTAQDAWSCKGCDYRGDEMAHIRQSSTYLGHAGGRCHMVEYACGRVENDESDDLRAAI